MFLSAVSVLVVAQSSSEFPEGLMNNPVYLSGYIHMPTKKQVMTVQLCDIQSKKGDYCFQNPAIWNSSHSVSTSENRSAPKFRLIEKFWS